MKALDKQCIDIIVHTANKDTSKKQYLVTAITATIQQ